MEKELKIIVAENGFVVEAFNSPGMQGKMWAFETPDSLAKHIKKWGEGQVKAETQINNSNLLRMFLII